MRDHRPTESSQLLAQQGLQGIQQRSKDILALQQALQQCLPAHTAKLCRAANLRDGQAIVEVASASLKMKLNYDRLRIISALRQQGYPHLTGLEISINPDIYAQSDTKERAPKATKKRRPMSAQTAQMLSELAETASPKLKAQLQKLAAMGQGSPRGDGRK